MSIDDKDGQASRSINLGRLALGRQRWAEARQWCEKALQLAREIGRQNLIASAQHGLARVYEAEGQPNLALPLAQEALAIRERLRSSDEGTRQLMERLRQAVDGR